MKFNSDPEKASFFSTYQIYYNNNHIDCEAVVYINSKFKYLPATDWIEGPARTFTTELHIDTEAGQYPEKVTKKHYTQLLTGRPAAGEGTTLLIKVDVGLSMVNDTEEEDETIIIVEDPDPSEG